MLLKRQHRSLYQVTESRSIDLQPYTNSFRIRTVNDQALAIGGGFKHVKHRSSVYPSKGITDHVDFGGLRKVPAA
jgi:hypothetical protein